jgi:hypothetical protein
MNGHIQKKGEPVTINIAGLHRQCYNLPRSNFYSVERYATQKVTLVQHHGHGTTDFNVLALKREYATTTSLHYLYGIDAESFGLC